MKPRIPSCFVVICSGLFCVCISCQKKDSEVVNQQYLNSKPYTQFRSETAQENKLNNNRDNALVQLFKTFPQCENVAHVDLPATINLKRVKALQKKVSVNCRYRIGDNSQRMTVEFIGESSFQNKKLRWIIIAYDELYRDQQLGVAVYKNPDILGFSEIGAFQSNLSKEVRTEITAKEHSNEIIITAATKWKQKYPIKQSNTFKSLYEITKDGKILRR